MGALGARLGRSWAFLGHFWAHLCSKLRFEANVFDFSSILGRFLVDFGRDLGRILDDFRIFFENGDFVKSSVFPRENQ